MGRKVGDDRREHARSGWVISGFLKPERLQATTSMIWSRRQAHVGYWRDARTNPHEVCDRSVVMRCRGWRPIHTAGPRYSTSARKSSATVVLPIPASPLMVNITRLPAATDANVLCSPVSSSSRPTTFLRTPELHTGAF